MVQRARPRSTIYTLQRIQGKVESMILKLPKGKPVRTLRALQTATVLAIITWVDTKWSST